MPDPKAEVKARLAQNTEAEPGENPLAFPYQHFSAYVDKTRGLPLVTACNIDGKKLKSINRKTGAVSDAESIPVEPLPEAREKWWVDPRITSDECGNDSLYTNQRVSSGPNRLGRIFHRGHMVRRLDPCWGTKARALRAEADTFHFTNCTPQVGKFNSGKALWQGIENHVLDNAKTDDIRVTVFTGTVLDDNSDPPYRQEVFPGFKVPMQFWKIAVWVEDGVLSALGMIADQTESLPELPERMEALDDDEGVRDFVTTVIEIEGLTGLNFGPDVRNADLYVHVDGPERARKRREVHDMNEVPLKRKAQTRRDSKRKSSR
jgi:endonuclease G